jgi:3-oxoadipate enol-lactonase
MNNTHDTAGVHFVRTGPQRDVVTVFVHPVGLDLTYWGEQIAAFGDHDIIAYDLPGHGLSPGKSDDWTFDAAAATLERVIRASSARRANIVGISIGSMIAQAFALGHPALVNSLVLIGAAASFEEGARRSMRERADAARRDGMAAVLQTTMTRWFTPETIARRPDIIDRASKSMLAVDPLIYGAMWDMIAGLDTARRLHEIGCPTLIMTGEEDAICPPAVAQWMHEQIRGSRVAVVAEAAHMCILEQPAFINACLAEFFDRCEAMRYRSDSDI